MSVIGSMATAASLTWLVVTEQSGANGETAWILVALALVAMPIAALVAALLTGPSSGSSGTSRWVGAWFRRSRSLLSPFR